MTAAMYRRGEMYYFHGDKTDSLNNPNGKPGIIVSCSELNGTKDRVQVVPISKNMSDLTDDTRPCRFIIDSPGPYSGKSLVFCDRSFPIRTDKIGEYIRDLTDDEITKLNRCLSYSLDLDCYIQDQIFEEIQRKRNAGDGAVGDFLRSPLYIVMSNRIELLQRELEIVRKSYAELTEAVTRQEKLKISIQ